MAVTRMITCLRAVLKWAAKFHIDPDGRMSFCCLSKIRECAMICARGVSEKPGTSLSRRSQTACGAATSGARIAAPVRIVATAVGAPSMDTLKLDGSSAPVSYLCRVAEETRRRQRRMEIQSPTLF